MAVGDKVHFPFTEATVDSGTYIYSGTCKLVFSTGFVAANTYDVKVNGTAITTTTFATTSAAMLSTIATNLAAAAPIDTATVTGINEITIVPNAGYTLVFTDSIVAAGASQAKNSFLNTAGQSICVPMIYVKVIT